VEKATAPPSHRRPPALLPPSTARLGGFAALALLGALQWQRMVEDLSAAHALLWVAVAVAAAAGILWADARRRLRGTATLLVAALGVLGAYASSGLPLALLKPRRLDELGAGLSHGTEALTSVKMPYQGVDPWPAVTLELLGALLCVLAALLAFWPRTQPTSSGATGEAQRGYQFLALALLLVMVAAPVVSLGGTEPVALGFALTALTVCFLWLERLPIAPGLGIAAMLALALAGALPLAGAADREDPWFDYKAFAEGLGPDEPLSFNWGHSYGPITWPRDGAEVLRVDARRPSYWKIADLDEFDGDTWIDTGADDAGTAAPELGLARDWRRHPAWRETLRVTLRRLETDRVVGAGTTLGVEDTSRVVGPSAEPGLWRSETVFRAGDSYTVKGYVPRPTASQLAVSSSGAEMPPGVELELRIPTEAAGGLLPRGPGAESDAAGGAGDDRDLRRRRLRAEVQFNPFTPFGRGPVPFASYPTLVRSNDGDRALRGSPYAETWQLARRLMRQSATPYEYVVAVDQFLQDGFTYDETPAPVSPGRGTLDGFLFETRSGYCQHFSGAMAILLRMGGVPARVATGFSPGGYSERKGAWIVRDTDAHSWVEVWFDDHGWVAFDPTPAGTPARSQIAALDRPATPSSDSGGDDGPGGSAARTGGVRPDLAGPQSGPGGTAAAGGGGDGPAWWRLALAGLAALALVAWGALRWRRRSLGPAAALDRAVAELEAALRRIGRPATAGTTLRQLEQRLGRSPEAAAYLRALRAGRYAPTATATVPSSRGRRALRRELGSGSGARGRLRALWALPPWR
jgi:protein-glutamine gamma-glutamyltransferase